MREPLSTAAVGATQPSHLCFLKPSADPAQGPSVPVVGRLLLAAEKRLQRPVVFAALTYWHSSPRRLSRFHEWAEPFERGRSSAGHRRR